jgi:membrane protein implicated in regulation of membrane protease activity
MTIWTRLYGLFTLRLSALLTLIGLAFMVWSMAAPTPLPVMLAMTVGQAFGTAAFAIYLFIVVRELRRELQRGRPRDPS